MTIEHLAMQALAIITGFLLVLAAIENKFKKNLYFI